MPKDKGYPTKQRSAGSIKGAFGDLPNLRKPGMDKKGSNPPMSVYGKIAKPSGENRKNSEGKHLPLSTDQGSKIFEGRSIALTGRKGHVGHFEQVHKKNGGGTMNPMDTKYSGPHAREG